MNVAKFSTASDIKISRCLESLNINLYYRNARINKLDCQRGSSPNWCQYYIVRIEYLWGNRDVYHFSAKMDGSGQIDYIKIHPENNQNYDKILNMIQSNMDFWGIKISNIERGMEHRDGGGNIEFIRFDVQN